MTDKLFSNLPGQPPPRTIYTDQHALEPCTRCNGSGVIECKFGCEECSAIEGPNNTPCYGCSGIRRMPEFNEPCRQCKGAGQILRRIAPVTDSDFVEVAPCES